MSDQLIENLARTLEIAPEDILDFSPRGGGKYNVVVVNFMKFVDVKPTEPQAELAVEQAEAEKTAAAPARKRASRRRAAAQK